MPAIPRIAQYADELTRWRRDIHAHPELGFEEERTSDLVAEQLARFGIEVHRGIGKTGVVGGLRRATGRASGCAPTWMPADPRGQQLRPSLAAMTAGCMPAAMTATRRCCSARRAISRETRNFDGTVHFIFQPAEEGLGGAEAMVEDGLFDALPVRRDLRHAQPAGPRDRQVPDPPGRDDGGRRLFRHRDHRARRAWRAARSRASIRCSSASHITTALQTIVSRNVRPIDTAVVSVTQIHAGDAYNVIPEQRGDARHRARLQHARR